MKGKFCVFNDYKKVSSAWCLQSGNCWKIGTVDAFSSENAKKREKKHIQRQKINKEGTANVFRC